VAEELYVLPSSYGQERMWLLEQVDAGSGAHNIVAAVRIRGALVVSILAQALTSVIERHEVLRTVLRLDGPGITQVVSAAEPANLAVVRASDEDEAAAYLARRARMPFDLGAGPLINASLLRLGEEDHMLVLVLHHAIADGWSLGVLLRELELAYTAAAEGTRPALPELSAQYADYAAWQREQLTAGVFDSQLSYWRDKLSGAPALRLPADPEATGQQTDEAATASVTVPATITRQLRAVASGGQATAFMVGLAGFAALLMRWTGQSDLTVGVPVAGRTEPELEPLIGFFVNTLPIRIQLAGDPSFAALLGHVRTMSLGAYDNAGVPFEVLVDLLRPQRRAGHLPLVQAMLAASASPLISPVEFAGLKLEPVPLPPPTTNFDVIADLTDSAGQLSGTLSLRPDLFTPRTAELAASSMQVLLRAAAISPATPLSGLPCPVAPEQPSATSLTSSGGSSGKAASTDGELGRAAARQPSSVVEHLLIQLWTEVLELDDVGPDDEFYACGGNSLRAVRVVTRGRELGLDLPMELVLGEHTIRELAAMNQGTP
jgi:hypothetical protein